MLEAREAGWLAGSLAGWLAGDDKTGSVGQGA
jgi:hypothetical protein